MMRKILLSPPRKRKSNHGNSSQPSKKLKTKLGGEVLKPLTSVVNGGGSRSNSQTNGTMTVAGKATGESVQLTNYMSTLIHAAPVPLPQKNQLNETEMISCKMSVKKDNEPVSDDDDNESVENGEENREDDNEEDEDNIMVEDVNLPNSQRSKSRKDRGLSSKVLLSEFANPKLASYRAVTNTMTNLQELSADYVDLLQTELYEAMLTTGPDIFPSQTYDYADLNAFAASTKSSAIGQGGTDADNGNSNGNNNNNNGNDNNGNGRGNGNSSSEVNGSNGNGNGSSNGEENGNSNGDAE
ncbi:hypothetical protein BT96DRAFT_992472 [Gymnopus androsaceus JB14]|uniref:Uncharacterized protein n=1 Tax=Gymnopus androsaceus JB14 TaxID=1447944 RepID=A0A6A4HW32_9AGAR|nr:hypothetical protein BT96DRAFT_992472 [Gymnopus androsaceus JB14]